MKKIAILTLIVFMLPAATDALEVGVASWYGGGEKLNTHTANGEIFNPQELTCACWDYPFHTRLKVTNFANGKSVIVRVNDRGPKKLLGRAIDLTKNAFSQIADTNEGLALVKIEKINR